MAVSSANWETATDAVLATAGTFPDALAAVALAARLDAPLLLTDRAALAPAVAAELERLGAGTVWVLGGQAALSTAVEDAVRALGADTRRLAGGDRYATAAAVAQQAGASSSNEVTLALGENWPDAVAAGALAATPDPLPTLLTRRDVVPDATLDAIDALEADQILLVGGSAVVTAAVADQLAARGLAVRRLAGPTRYDTSVAAARDALTRRTGATPIVFASGHGFADALPAGALAARAGGPLLLVPRAALDDAPPTRDFVAQYARELSRGIVVGGRVAVTDDVVTGLAELISR